MSRETDMIKAGQKLGVNTKRMEQQFRDEKKDRIEADKQRAQDYIEKVRAKGLSPRP